MPNSLEDKHYISSQYPRIEFHRKHFVEIVVNNPEHKKLLQRNPFSDYFYFDILLLLQEHY